MGWRIVGIIFIVILLLTLGKVKIIVDYSESLILKIKYMFFPIVTVPSKKKNAAKAKKKNKKDKGEPSDKKNKKDGKEDKKKKKKLALEDLFALLKLVLDSLGKPLRKIIKRIEISHLALNITCGGEDAAKAAITYGAVNLGVGNLLGWLDTFFTLKPVDDLSINVDFESEETTADAYVEVKLVVAAAFAFVFTLIGRALKHYFTHKPARVAVGKMVSTEKPSEADKPSLTENSPVTDEAS